MSRVHDMGGRFGDGAIDPNERSRRRGYRARSDFRIDFWRLNAFCIL